MSRQAFDKERYTDLLHFVVIHSDPGNVSHLDSLKGTHIHAIKDSLVDKSTPHPTSQNLPTNTVIAHGTVYDLAAGRFSSGITEQDRRERIGGDIGIASHSALIQGKMTLNDEAIIVGGKAYLGAYDGSGRKLTDDDQFAFLQVLSLDNATELALPSCKNTADMVAQIQSCLPQGTTSFAAYFTGYLPKEQAVSRTIRGMSPQGKRYTNLKEAWRGWKEYSANEQPVLAHVIGFEENREKGLEGLVIASPVKAVPIERFLIADKKGSIVLNNGAIYRKTTLPDIEHKAAQVIQQAYRKHSASKQDREIQRRINSQGEILSRL
jgi:alpha-acetolactate decarboxylase